MDCAFDGAASGYADDADLQAAFYSALTLCGISDYSVEASFKTFSSVKTMAEISRARKMILAQVSDAYRLAPREVLLGLALDACARLFHRKVQGKYVEEFRRFQKRGSLLRLSDSIRQMRGRKRKDNSAGEFFDLEKIGAEVYGKYSVVLGMQKMPKVLWNDRGGRRTLAFYDRAFDKVLISRVFDSPNVPRAVIEYLCFHEFLHAKHAPLYERGKSMRTIVHSRAFKKDEEKFEGFEEADGWIERKAGRLG